MAAVTAGAAAAPAVRRLVRAVGAGGGADDADRWHAVTVLCPPKEAEARRDTPLAALGDAVEVRVVPAPGDRGSELHARLAPAGDGNGNGRSGGRRSVAERVEELRTALRETKQVLEIGWVVQPDRPGTTRPTPLNAPLRAVTAHARGRGWL
jgi:hypothetical protein